MNREYTAVARQAATRLGVKFVNNRNPWFTMTWLICWRINSRVLADAVVRLSSLRRVSSCSMLNRITYVSFEETIADTLSFWED